MSDREAEVAEDASVDPVADRVQVNDAVDDATVMVDDSTVMVDDATRAVSRPEADDLTKVVARPADAAVDDATVVSASRSASGPQDESDSLEDSVPSAAIVHAGSASHGTFADYMSGSRGTSTSGTGLDPKRRIARVPDRMPWEVAPTAEAGVHQGLPVVYGPRDLGEAGSAQGLDEIHRRIGPAPAASPVPVREGREALPSLERRERKRRTATLVLYGGVVVVALLGLWGVAVLAFG